MRIFRKSIPAEPWTHIGAGIHLDYPETILDLGFPDTHRKGHFWCFGTTRVGKTKIMEHIIEQDIRKGYSVVAIDPKGDIDLFSKIVEIADDTNRLEDLMLVTPIFPEYSAILDSLSSYYMPEELVAHITAGVAVGREPYFFGVAYEVSLVVVQALIILAESVDEVPSFNLNDIKNHISHQGLKVLKEKHFSCSAWLAFSKTCCLYCRQGDYLHDPGFCGANLFQWKECYPIPCNAYR